MTHPTGEPPNAEPDPPGRLLGEIRRQLDQVESDLSQRQQRLARAERELDEARARLTVEQAAIVRQRRQADQQADQRIADAQAQVERHQQALHEQRRQNEQLARRQEHLTAQIGLLTQQRDRLAAELDEARQQLARQRPVCQPAEANDACMPALVATSRSRGTLSARRTAILRVAAFAGGVAVLAALWAYARYQPGYRITAALTVRPGDAETLVACTEDAAARGVSTAARDIEQGVIELVLESPERLPGITQVDEVGRAIVDRAAALRHTATAGRADVFAAQTDLLHRLDELDERFSAVQRQLAGDAGDDEPRLLLERWTAAESRRREVSVALANLQQHAATEPSGLSDVRLDPERIQVVERSDEKLQAELALLAQHETEFTDTLVELLDSGSPHLDALIGAAAEGRQYVVGALDADYDEKTRALLQVVDEAIGSLMTAASALAEVWQEQRQYLSPDAGTADLLTGQGRLEQAARAFVDETAASRVSYEKAVEALGQADGQPTKALVLQGMLKRELRPMVEARQGTELAARALMLTDSRDLAALTQKVAGLRDRVQQRRAGIEDTLRRRTMVELQAERDRQIRDRRRQLTREAHELDETIDRCIADARSLLGRSTRQQELFAELAELQRLRVEARRVWLQALETAPAQAGASASWPEVHYVPARAEVIRTPAGRIHHGFIVGFVTLLLASAVGGAACAIHAWRGTRQTMETYTRELEMLKNRR